MAKKKSVTVEPWNDEYDEANEQKGGKVNIKSGYPKPTGKAEASVGKKQVNKARINLKSKSKSVPAPAETNDIGKKAGAGAQPKDENPYVTAGFSQGDKAVKPLKRKVI